MSLTKKSVGTCFPTLSLSSNLVDINKFKTLKEFSKLKAKGFGLLSSGLAKSLIKGSFTIINAKSGDLSLDDPSLLLVLDLIGKNKGILYYSVNTPEEELVGKLILALSGLNELMVKRGALNQEGEAQDLFEKACSVIHGSNLKIANGSIINSLWLEVKKLKQNKELDYVIIDHLEGFSIDFMEQKDNIQEILEHFNEMSLNVEVPIILISRR